MQKISHFVEEKKKKPIFIAGCFIKTMALLIHDLMSKSVK